MCRLTRAILGFVILFPVSARASESSLVTYAKSLKGQQFVLRAHEDLFGHPKVSTWDGRLLYETAVAFVDGDVAIGGEANWRGNHFVAATTYAVKDVARRGNDVIQFKLRQVYRVTTGGEPEVKLNFDVSAMSLEQFKKAFFTVFFDPSENRDAYIQENDRKLVARFIDPEPELFQLPDAERLKLLAAIKAISLSSQPRLERLGKSLYVAAAALGDTSAYNDIRVSKNQRIASSIEALLPDLRRTAKATGDLPEAIAGIKFEWSVYHRNFLEDSKYGEGANAVEHMEMLVPRETLKSFADGNLSAFELVQKSVVRENGIKVSLTSYEPIGSR